MGDREWAGVQAFCLHDTPRAFEQAYTAPQLEELLRESNLGRYFKHVDLLKSTFLLGLMQPINPVLNIVTGIKS